MKSKTTNSVHVLMATQRSPILGKVIDYERYSTMSRLLRVTAYVLRAMKMFKKGHPEISTDLRPEEFAEAKKLWIVDSQQKLVEERKFPTWKNQFNLFLDDKGLWRCGGRLGNANLPYSTKHPILLPHNHPITPLIVRDAHKRVQHNGIKETLTEVRTKYWIVKGRSLVRSIIHRCIVCRRFEGAPYRGPLAPPLPTFRVQEERPIPYTGVDCAGWYNWIIRSKQGLDLPLYMPCCSSCLLGDCDSHVHRDIHQIFEAFCCKKGNATKAYFR